MIDITVFSSLDDDFSLLRWFSIQSYTALSDMIITSPSERIKEDDPSLAILQYNHVLDVNSDTSCDLNITR